MKEMEEMEETVLIQVGVNKSVLADNLLQEPCRGDAEERRGEGGNTPPAREYTST